MQLPPEPLTRGLPPPDPRSLYPVSSTEFVEPPPPNKIPGYATETQHGRAWTGLIWRALVNTVCNFGFCKIPRVTSVAEGNIASSFSGRSLVHGVKWRVSCSELIRFITVTLLCNLHVCTVHQWRIKHFIIQQMHKYTVIPRLTKIIRSGITFVSRNLR